MRDKVLQNWTNHVEMAAVQAADVLGFASQRKMGITVIVICAGLLPHISSLHAVSSGNGTPIVQAMLR